MNLLREDDLLDRAIEALRQTPVPEGPPTELLEAAARLAVSPRPRRRFVRALVRCAAVILMVVLVWQSAAWVGVFQESLAFADVVARVRQTHNVFFMSTVTTEGKDPFVCECTLAEPGLTRMQFTQDSGRATLIFDDVRSEGLLLVLEERIAMALSSAADLPKETGSTTVWYHSLRGFGHESVDDLGPRQIAGKATFGFRVKQQGQHFDIWVDRKTALPVRVEANMSARGHKARLVSEGFVYDGDLPPERFSLVPPQGYMIAGKLELAMPEEKDLIYVLRLAANLNGKNFPESLDVKALDSIMDKDPRNNKSHPEGSAFAVKIAQALVFIHKRQTEGEWHYQGKGVKLDDAVKVICAWKKTGDTKYRAVFGDLGIRTVEGGKPAGLGAGEVAP